MMQAHFRGTIQQQPPPVSSPEMEKQKARVTALRKKRPAPPVAIDTEKEGE